MKNDLNNRFSEIILALAVPAGTVAGTPVLLGTAGLAGIAETDRFVAGTYTGFIAAPQGLKDGQASVRLIGVISSATLTVDAAGAQYAPVYITNSTGAVSLTATAGTKIGYLLSASAGAGLAPVALSRA